jgi:type II secretory pathway predicted ATPase ExeA
VYESYWGLKEKPFKNTPDPRFLYKSKDLAETYGRLLYALKSHQGLILLVGESGCGKTLVLRSLLSEIASDKLEIALINSPNPEPNILVGEILIQLGHEPSTAPHLTLHNQLNALLYEHFAASQDTIIAIDEGQLLADNQIFEEIRQLLNLQLDDAFLLTLFIVGQIPLAQRVRGFPLLDERIAARGVVRALDKDDVGPYIQFRLQVAGRTEPLFSPEAIEVLSQYTGGIPRRINNICDLCLAAGYSRQIKDISGDLAYQLILSEESTRV